MSLAFSEAEQIECAMLFKHMWRHLTVEQRFMAHKFVSNCSDAMISVVHKIIDHKSSADHDHDKSRTTTTVMGLSDCSSMKTLSLLDEIMVHKPVERGLSTWEDSGYLYIVQNPLWYPSVFKFGITKNLRKRFNNYNSAGGTENIEIKRIWVCKHAKEIEDRIKELVIQWKHSRRREYVVTNVENLVSIIESALKKDVFLSEDCKWPVYSLAAPVAVESSGVPTPSRPPPPTMIITTAAGTTDDKTIIAKEKKMMIILRESDVEEEEEEEDHEQKQTEQKIPLQSSATKKKEDNKMLMESTQTTDHCDRLPRRQASTTTKKKKQEPTTPRLIHALTLTRPTSTNLSAATDESSASVLTMCVSHSSSLRRKRARTEFPIVQGVGFDCNKNAWVGGTSYVKKKTFSVTKHGDEEARSMAIQYLNELVQSNAEKRKGKHVSSM
jgi:hypothetical protein